jgi:hypothetical protein
MALADNGLFGTIAGKKSIRQLHLYRLATGHDRLRVAVPRAPAIRVPEETST